AGRATALVQQRRHRPHLGPRQRQVPGSARLADGRAVRPRRGPRRHARRRRLARRDHPHLGPGLTMHTARSFIAAIRETPDDDTPRLVFSDWLEEQGEIARAELIRVQCELARLPTFDPRYPELHLRQLELIAAHEAEWLGEWADRLVRWEFRRG